MAAPLLTLSSPQLTAEINPFGAELWRLRDAAGRDLLWDGDPAWWPGRAPLLFPTIGRLPDDGFTHAGRTFPLPRHGFARRRAFEVLAHEPTRARLRLAADDETRAVYPFEFALEAEFAVEGPELRTTIRVSNLGAEPMPATFGFHPAFRWPLPDGGQRADHALVFAAEEHGPVRRLGDDGLLTRAPVANPVEGRRLALRDALFGADAVIFEHPASTSVRYGGTAGPSLTVSWSGLPNLGVWSKPGAPFVCIEPWQALPADTGAPRALADRSDFLHLAAGEAREVSMAVRLD